MFFQLFKIIFWSNNQSYIKFSKFWNGQFCKFLMIFAWSFKIKTFQDPIYRNVWYWDQMKGNKKLVLWAYWNYEYSVNFVLFIFTSLFVYRILEIKIMKRDWMNWLFTTLKLFFLKKYNRNIGFRLRWFCFDERFFVLTTFFGR